MRPRCQELWARSRLLAEAERQDPSLRPFLVGIKDIVNVADLPTRAGSTLPDRLFAGPEATVVTRLRAAGAIVLGKTTTTEFAFSEPAPTTNPHDERHTPGGSSSSSAAAVAARYVPLAIGTQTVDSIVTPAAYCGVVGFKPSYGRVSSDGVVPFSQAMDQVGFLAHDVETVVFAAEIVYDGWRATTESALPAIGLPAPSHLNPLETVAHVAFDRTVASLSAAGCRVLHTDSLGIDVWMSPAATGPAPRGLDSTGDPIMAVPWTHAHLPVVCLPAGTVSSGLPLGNQLVGRFGADEQLLGFARAVARSLD